MEYNNVSKDIEDGDALRALRNGEIRTVIKMLMGTLTNREQNVLSDYFGLGEEDEMTLEEIGKKLGLTKERVRQIKEKALKKLRAEALKNSITKDIYN